MKKRNLFFALLVVVFAITGMKAFAGTTTYGYDFIVNDVYYKKTSGTTVAVSWHDEWDGYSGDSHTSGYKGNIVIPTSVTYAGITYSVASIASQAFYDYDSDESVVSKITSVSIPSSIISIGSSAFLRCILLEELILPETLNTIDNWAFYGCTGLSDMVIPDAVTSMGEYAFGNCTGLETVTIGNAVTSINAGTFSGCSNLAEITIGKSVSFIASDAFNGCSSLKKINISPDNPYFCFENDILYNKEKTAIVRCFSDNSTISIPETVSSIGTNAFRDCKNLKEIYMPNSILTLGENAFYGCSNLESVTLSEALTSINNYAFYGCSALKTINLSSNISSIGEWAFYGCKSISQIILPENVTSIGQDAFRDCSSLSAIKMNQGLQSIGSYAFYFCTLLKTINIPSSVTEIGNYAFSGCSGLASIIVNWNTSAIPDITSGVFSSDTYQKATLYSSLYWATESKLKEMIGWSSFKSITYYTKITSISLAPTIKTLIIGKTATLTATIQYSWSNVQDLVWTSSDERVAIVKDGTITAISAGEATISATTLDGSNLTATCKVTVKYANSIYADDIRMKITERTSILPIFLDNEVAMCGYEFNLVLPENVSIQYSYDEEEEKYMFGIRNGERARSSHITKCTKKDDGSYYIFCYSSDNENFYDTETQKGQPVLYVTLTGEEGLTQGKYDVLLKQIVMNHNENDQITEYKIERMQSLLDVPFDRTVTFTVDGTVYSSGVQTAGDLLQIPKDPIKTGYTFTGWKNVTSTTIVPDHDVTYEAVFNINQYTITFVVDDETYSTGKQTYGKAITRPANPTKTGFTFTGWNGLTDEATVPASDATYTAMFTINHYMVTFMADGKVVYQKEQEWGSAIVPPAAPVKKSYVFVTWGDVESTVPLQDVTYTAQYTMVGDVFNDDKVNISDLTTLVNILVNKSSTDGRTFKAADINGDTKLNITDLTSLVNIMTSSNRGNSVSRRTLDRQETNIQIGNDVLLIDRDNSIHISLENGNTPVANLQFDLVLPYGVRLANGNTAESVNTSSRTANHSVSLSEQEDGSIRIFLYTFQNDAVVGGEGDILDIIVETKGLEREEELVVKNVVMNDAEGSEICIDEIRKQVTLLNTTSITTNGIDNNGPVWDAQGIRYKTYIQGINIINGSKKYIK